LHPLPNLNYTFYPLGRELAALVNSVGFVTPTIRNLPEQLTAIGFPSLEAEHFLNHCTIGHELGHCLYLKRNCEQELMPRVQLNAQELNDLVKNLAEARIFTGSSEQPERQPTLSEYFSEVEIGSSVTKEINDYCASWLKELTCDAIAYRLLGPSYLFADLNFLTSLTSFDGDESKTHPPNRMRFKLLYTMLDLEHPLDNKSASTEIFDTNVIDFLRFWKDVTFSKEPSFTNPIRRLAGNAILNMYSDIISTATSVVAEIGSYDLFKHVQEVQKLNKRIKMFAPPNELIEDGEVKEAKFQSILNVGWLAYIGQLKTIAKKYGWQLNKCKEKVNDLIAKAVELNEIQRRWKELQQ
jgi:hypothetical protein